MGLGDTMNYDEIHEYLQKQLEESQQMNCDSLQIRNPRNALYEAKSVPDVSDDGLLIEGEQDNLVELFGALDIFAKRKAKREKKQQDHKAEADAARSKLAAVRSKVMKARLARKSQG